MSKDEQIRRLREALEPFTNTGPGGRLLSRAQDFDRAKQVYEETAPVQTRNEWAQRVISARDEIAATLNDFETRFGPVGVLRLHSQLMNQLSNSHERLLSQIGHRFAAYERYTLVDALPSSGSTQQA